ncbi:tRNA N(3)-methylcytidine methyltransferase METTL6-like [Liolophura sinensis]|uniref:tRNA N(3)-methylcytidine methyltransferase METTL6-like n=1 Tax=Liolophura sinensis TaxID=3198878 RepID=UPI0031595BEB
MSQDGKCHSKSLASVTSANSEGLTKSEEDFTQTESVNQYARQIPRTLTDSEQEKLEKDKTFLSEFKQKKLELEAHKNWDKFYKRNTTKFFKDRHWTKREFQELCGECGAISDEKLTLLEVGCGVGNFLFPLLEDDNNLFIFACDFSPRAIDFVKENPLYEASRCDAFVCDVVNTPLSDHIPLNTVDVATLIFVLSAIHPEKMQEALRNIHQVLKPGGILLFRDYGLYDYAMLRFSPGRKLAENFYVRQDGTRVYYFSTEILHSMTQSAGFQTVTLDYVQRETVNKKEDLCVPRIFVQGKFQKTIEDINLPNHSQDETCANSANV